MNTIFVYPGTFDPVTFGHLDVIKRASLLCDKLVIAVAKSDLKNPFFSLEERVVMLREAVSEYKNVEVDFFSGLVVDYAHKKGARVVIRGLRMISDFEYEFQMALTNRKFSDKVETMFMMPHESYSYISSRLIKEAAFMGADISKFVPQNVIFNIKNKMGA
ncbi:Coenzyme A biosynthesis protein [Candidatus Omnitrophus magneticus]|uniref:Phosphopantetheine adenylyltransferase n=1 Tax=Candidatus Omnitrophus magneticus TaxID=1609969 RepID=A0A0F0CLV1_9BACT|nr:Coenzyme A biosynthesis protein [Candidatus Omnitrophus magneticus]